MKQKLLELLSFLKLNFRLDYRQNSSQHLQRVYLTALVRDRE